MPKEENENVYGIELAVEKFDEYMNAVAEVAKEHAPGAVELGLGAVRVEALSEVIPSIILMMISAIVLVFLVKQRENLLVYKNNHHILYQALQKSYKSRTVAEDRMIEEVYGRMSSEIYPSGAGKEQADEYINTTINVKGKIDPDCVSNVVVVVGGALVALVLLFSTVSMLFKTWPVIGIFYPELYAVYLTVLK